MKDEAERSLVLLVDDEPLLLDGLRIWLEGNGRLRVLSCGSAAAALEIIDRHGPDLVVSDVRMPGMDGIELLLVCRSRFPRIRFALMSAFGTPALEARSRRDGAVRFFHKPVEPDRLEREVLDLLGLERDQQRSGFLCGVSVQGFLQLLAMERKTVALRLRAGDGQEGTLYLADGSLVHAELGDWLGEGAALELVGWEQPEMEIAPWVPAGPRTVQENLPSLIMEAACLRDEKERTG
ncbi:MAG: response regulator [Deltaproteobacteria bacterium]|nr:response regulator [Deltaproteobacteria bacterium]